MRSRDRAVLAWGTRLGRLTPSQAWRWFFPGTGSVKVARNRLRELEAAGLVVRVPMRQGQESVCVPTPLGARQAGIHRPDIGIGVGP